ncbi:zinc finger protein 862-like [Ostrea edulis]|nr:zinc finger protein 862-like [Ostrea edulis]
MTCSVCVERYASKSGSNRTPTGISSNLKGQNTFLDGCTNFRVTAVVDHESSVAHKKAIEFQNASAKTGSDILTNTSAGKALQSLRKAEKDRLVFLFRNAHAVMKHNRPMRDYTWLCSLDQVKGIDLGGTYINDKAAIEFVKSIAATERDNTVDFLSKVNFFSIMMDGSTDISGDEQEALYLRFSLHGKVTERFLAIGTPNSTCAVDLESFLMKVFTDCRIDKAKLVGMGSDGASNMVGKKGGLSALLKNNINDELVNVHCFAHRLELAFRDVLKKSKLYDRLMTLLIGLYYFYTKQYKNKRGLLDAIRALNVKGVVPTKVTGTRWLAHLFRGMNNMMRTFQAYEAHLCSLSHKNPKAEGLAKILLRKDLVCFVLFLQEALEPLMRLSLKLQKTESTVADSVIWAESTIELLEEFKTSLC